jgi:hypothetical protein
MTGFSANNSTESGFETAIALGDDVVGCDLVSALPPISSRSSTPPAISDLSDQQVIALTHLEMEPAQDIRLGELLDKQQSGTLNPEEPQELDTLMQIYREGLLRKAAALAEAVKRGLDE